MPKIEVTAEHVTITDAGNRSVYEILEARPPNVRYTTFVVDDEGRQWAAAWVQTRPDTMDAYAFDVDASSRSHNTTASHDLHAKRDGRVG